MITITQKALKGKKSDSNFRGFLGRITKE